MFKQTVSKLLTIAGIGIITAATIYAEVGDFKNFLETSNLNAFSVFAVRFLTTINDYYYNKRDQGKHHKVVFDHVSRKLLRMIYYIQFIKLHFTSIRIIGK